MLYGIDWRSIIVSVTLLATLFDMYLNLITIPSCNVVFPANSNPNESITSAFDDTNSEELTAVLVSNLLLRGADSSAFDIYFRDFFLSQFFLKSFETLKPDLLLILGDVAAKGYELKSEKWSSVIEQLERMLGPYLNLPFHVTLGDRDIGECSKLKASSVHRIASSFPELNRGGCGIFEMNNVSFISLNAMALLCGNNALLPAVETVIERESEYLRSKTEDGREQTIKLNVSTKASYQYGWRDNPASSQSGPVLLLHFPLLHIPKSCSSQDSSSSTILNFLPDSLKLQLRAHSDSGPYDLMHTVPPNATEYIFQAIKPRIVFSGHSHEFCDIIHPDGTREVSIPALAWKAKDDPGLVAATFRRNGTVTIRRCFLPRESHVVVSCITIFILSISAVIVPKFLYCLNVRNR